MQGGADRPDAFVEAIRTARAQLAALEGALAAGNAELAIEFSKRLCATAGEIAFLAPLAFSDVEVGEYAGAAEAVFHCRV